MRSTEYWASAPMRFCAKWVFLCLAFPLVALAAPKTDVLVLTNGDRLTGEVKSLGQGLLSFNTDATGTIEVEWLYVASLQTKQFLEVELTSGARYLGQAPAGGATGTMRIATDDQDPGREVRLVDVVRIATIDRGRIWERLDGYVTGGYDYTKASDVQHLTLSAGVSTRTAIRSWSLDGSGTTTRQSDEPDTTRFDIDGGHRRFLAKRRFVSSFAALERNDELGLNLRTTLGAGYGTYLRQTQIDEWYGALGLAVTREDFATQPTGESVEGVLTTGYTYFRFRDPEASIDGRVAVFPSLTDSGRVRSEGRVRARYELVSDLFFELSLYGSFDSDPDEEANSNSDYGITTSLGYSF
jgi:hypothetical protein